jgi:prepilin-type N-terminal cleavage/methylation domain-containing protein
MKKSFGTIGGQGGFSLAEMLAALLIAAMVLVAVLNIYSRAENSAAAVIRKLDDPRMSDDVLQRIAEDLDGILASSSDTVITIENKFEKGYPTARLTIRKNIYDDKNQQQLFEEIIWQSSYDYDNGKGLILYRSHKGVALEDKLLDEKRKDWEKVYSFVPICTGITFFKIQVPRGTILLDGWVSPPLPPGITITISFAEPFETVKGTLDVAEAAKVIHTIAVDRTRTIRFETAPATEQQGEADEQQQDKIDEGKQNKAVEKQQSGTGLEQKGKKDKSNGK